MGSVIECLLRCCYDGQNNEGRRRILPLPPSTAQMNRALRPESNPTASGYHEASQIIVEASAESSAIECGNPSRSAEETEEGVCGPHQTGIREVLRALNDRFSRHEIIEATSEQETSIITEQINSKILYGVSLRENFGKGSYCRTSSSFDASKEIPTTHGEEVVLPGSDLQKQMAKCMSQTIEWSGDECVICMETFDPSNPRMPTLCGCGENKTYFHLPCLYQWIEQHPECPTCRQPLEWEEF